MFIFDWLGLGYGLFLGFGGGRFLVGFREWVGLVLGSVGCCGGGGMV